MTQRYSAVLGSQQSTLETLAALISGRVHPNAISTDLWPNIVALALQHNLGPALSWIVNQSDSDLIQHESLAGLMPVARMAAVRTMLLEDTMKRVNHALEAADIAAVWLKGSVLAQLVYADSMMRPMVDLDVLVPYEQREQALEIVQSIGFDYPEYDMRLVDEADEDRPQFSHHYQLVGGPANSVQVEVHFRLMGVDEILLPSEQLDWFWEQTQRVSTPKLSFTCLTPEAHLLHLCAHMMLQHGEAQSTLLRFWDVHQLISQESINWETVINQAVALGWTYALERLLSRCVQYFDTALPERVLAQLQARRPDHDRVMRAVMLQGAGERWEKTRVMLDRLTLPQKAHLIWLTLIPTRAYMRSRYPVKPWQPILLWYVYRWAAQSKDVGLWFINRIRFYNHNIRK